jgi:MHS family alpha-ketoglutarate permease-like MFS transporter
VLKVAGKPPRSRLKNIIGGSAGNLVEWFDWYVYSAFALYFASSFFPKGNQTAQLLQTAAIFAVGFIMRHATAEDADRVASEVHAVVGTTGD